MLSYDHGLSTITTSAKASPGYIVYIPDGSAQYCRSFYLQEAMYFVIKLIQEILIILKKTLLYKEVFLYLKKPKYCLLNSSRPINFISTFENKNNIV